MASGTVKFFNAAKGYGFIAPDGGGSDLFVHVSALERAGLRGLNEGDQVTFEVEEDRRSGKLTATDLRVTGSAPGGGGGGGRPSYGRPSGGFGGGRDGGRDFGGGGRDFGGGRDSGPRGGGAPRQVEGSGSGTVKWFNTTKGFGFIQPEGGGADIFVHVSAVERAGLRELREGQQVAFDVERDARSGKSAAVNLRVQD